MCLMSELATTVGGTGAIFCLCFHEYRGNYPLDLAPMGRVNSWSFPQETASRPAALQVMSKIIKPFCVMQEAGNVCKHRRRGSIARRNIQRLQSTDVIGAAWKLSRCTELKIVEPVNEKRYFSSSHSSIVLQDQRSTKLDAYVTIKSRKLLGFCTLLNRQHKRCRGATRMVFEGLVQGPAAC